MIRQPIDRFNTFTRPTHTHIWNMGDSIINQNGKIRLSMCIFYG